MFIVLQTVYNWLVWLCSSCYRTYIQWTTYKPVLTQEMKPLPQESYINKHKTRFLSTFEEPLASSRDWNENMKSLQITPEELEKELSYAENDIEKEWKRRVLIENTPRGNVIMYYDVYKRAFAYYCDQSTMPYDIMNAVAMRYVIAFFCRDLFVDESVIPKKSEEKAEKGEESEKAEKKSIDKDAPFAKFKNYNTTNGKLVKSKVVNKTTNKFIHLGQTRNYCLLNKPPKVFAMNGFATKLLPEAESKKPALSYAEFKAQQQSK